MRGERLPMQLVKMLPQTPPLSIVPPSLLICPLPCWATLLAASTMDGDALHESLAPPQDPQSGYDPGCPREEYGGGDRHSRSLVLAVHSRVGSEWGSSGRGLPHPRTSDFGLGWKPGGSSHPGTLCVAWPLVLSHWEREGRS